MNYALVSSILKGNWAIDPLFAINSLPFISDILSGKTEISIKSEEYIVNHKNEKVSTSHYAASLRNEKLGYDFYDWNDAPEGSVAVLTIRGSLTKGDMACGPVGMNTIGNRIKRANELQNISAIVLDIDSPGGTVDGTASLAKVIKDSKKPIVAFANGLVASAALWISSECEEIIASDKHAEIGSVGVLCSFWDIIPHYESKKYKYHQIVSSLSPDKVKLYEDLRAGKYDEYKKENLDPIAREFQDVITANFPNAEEKHIKGKVFFAKDVLGVFVNSIGDLDSAIARASELAINNKSNLNNNNTTMKTPKLNALLDTELESQDDQVSLSIDNIDVIEAALVSSETIASERDTAVANLETANSERDTAVSERDAAQTALETANATIADLQKRIPGAESADHGATEEVLEVTDINKEMQDLEKMSTAERIEYLRNQESE